MIQFNFQYLKNSITIFILFVIAVCNCYSQTWNKFSVDSIEVLMPGVPDVRSKDLHTSSGMMKATNFSIKPESTDPNFFYSLNIVEYPEDMIINDSLELIDSMLLTSLNQLVTTLKSKIVYSTQTKMQNKPTYIFRFMDDVSGQVTKGYISYAHQRLYTVMVFTMRDKSLNDNIDRFLESFKFTD